MTRKLTEKRLVIASHNPGKLREIADLLEPFGLSVVSAGDLGLPEPEETGQTFAANAELKAKAAGTVAQIQTDTGQTVEAGSVLVQLNLTEAEG